MALGVFMSGAFTATLNSVALGITEDGYTLEWEQKQDAIEKSDVYGESLIDSIYRGCNWYFSMDFLEDKAGPRAAVHPWGSAFGVQGVIGRLASDVATALVLTSTTGTPAVATPATLTATKAIVAPGFNSKALFSSRLRTMASRLALLPVDTGGGVIKSFTTT